MCFLFSSSTSFSSQPLLEVLAAKGGNGQVIRPEIKWGYGWEYLGWGL